MIELSVTEWANIPGHRWGAVIDPQALPEPSGEHHGYDVIPGLIPGERIKLDGAEYVIHAIERFAVRRWWAKRFGIFIVGEPQ